MKHKKCLYIQRIFLFKLVRSYGTKLLGIPNEIGIYYAEDFKSEQITGLGCFSVPMFSYALLIIHLKLNYPNTITRFVTRHKNRGNCLLNDAKYAFNCHLNSYNHFSTPIANLIVLFLQSKTFLDIEKFKIYVPIQLPLNWSDWIWIYWTKKKCFYM